MGSFKSRPKVSTPATQVVYYKPIASTTTATSASSSSGSVVTEPDAQEVATARVENVLRRKRSLVGNILTSFRGVLDSNSSNVSRKTLLGE
ncbi:MAG: hypothetical protein KDJ26_01230 [Alphaproteobacteria bacterium]|nr:hypothetical protein [Alphaproteobacteria bacterium]MCB1550601.1 hypothetical protein [Alphaproteobacteria bacterium]MCB9985466.1 hypothetical protein [Micavibrio sp.]HPQ50352.1 hypothetical protein [Alphaproteobacteria bacterium]HRK98714.1 hypothetical protein [Alphaproteobacteria bacterium]